MLCRWSGVVCVWSSGVGVVCEPCELEFVGWECEVVRLGVMRCGVIGVVWVVW